MKEIKIEPIKVNENWFEDIQKQIDETYQKTIDYGRTQFVNKIVELEQQLQMLTRLYQNEKDKNDTLRKDLQKSEKIIDIILEYGIYMDECPLNFSFDENSIQDKAQNVFYEDNGEYCENNCNDCYKKCWLKFFKEMQRLKEIK